METLRIAVIGAGRVGATLGARWNEAGHALVYGVRDPGAERHAQLGPTATPSAAVEAAHVVLLALPWAAVEEVASDLPVGAAVVIDATNPLAPGTRELAGAPEVSGAERIAAWLGSSRVVKAFNTTGSQNLADPTYAAGRVMMPLAGDDEAAKEQVATLGEAIGFAPIDAGPLTAARDLEHLAALWIRLAYPLGHGPDIAFSLLTR